MLDTLKAGGKVVGARQTMRALDAAQVQTVFLAADADPALTEPVERRARELGVAVQTVSGTRALGAACGIKVPAAVAALLR